LGNLQADRPYLRSSYCDVTDIATFPREAAPFETVICLNVIEHVPDDRSSLRNIRTVLAEGGRAIVLVPQGEWNYGTLDEVLGHRRRYDESSVRTLAADCGLEVERIVPFNRVGTIAWYLNGKVLRRRIFGLGQIMLLNSLTPLFRLLDAWLPVPPLSLIAVLRNPASVAAMPALQSTGTAAQ
ncbi:MAG: class I SAM-dependent methyltransferase, partial [Myxococcales bacterium]